MSLAHVLSCRLGPAGHHGFQRMLPCVTARTKLKNHMPMNDSLATTPQAVHDEASFLAFAHALLADRQAADGVAMTRDGVQGAWVNGSIASFMEGAIAWAEDSDFGARPGPKSSNPWALFAMFLWAGRGYE